MLRIFVKYQYEMAELQGKTAVWSNVFDNGKGIDASDFYSGVYGRINSQYGDAYGIDWQNEVFGGSALTQNHNVNVSTGTEKTQVMLSYNYSDQEGLLANHGIKRRIQSVRRLIRNFIKGFVLILTQCFQAIRQMVVALIPE